MNDEDICTEFPTELWSTLSDVFRKSVTEKIEGGTPTFTLVALAERSIACLEKRFSSGAIERDIYRLSTVHEDIRPEAVLGAMLAHATDDDTCTAPRRYVACSIVTAAAQDEQLIELANVWVRYLFWPFKANGCRRRDPSINETRISASSHSHFEDALRKRDGNRCVVTRVPDFSEKSAHVVTVTKPAHILKKVGVTGKRGEKLSSEHATWDILRRFAALSEEEVAELDASIDSIRNGLTLNICLHSFFDSFYWTLRPDPVYLDRYHSEPLLATPSVLYQRRIGVATFEDHAAELRPNRKLIQFYYSLSKVLHAGGTFRLMESMVKRFFPEGCMPTRLDCLNADDLLLYSIAEKMLQQMNMVGNDVMENSVNGTS